ncbi:MAG: PAS domain S-box protein [Candidatus Krumholzibacteriota bacterium]|nr:PAS domain S-box protein [Candidatus Krumholzibacteriota bacterium]
MQPSEYLASVLDSSPVALVSLDTKMRILLFNQAARAMTGFTDIDMVGRRITRIFPFEKIRKIIRALRKDENFLSNGYVTKLIGAQGREIPVRIKISPVRDGKNELIGMLILAFDLREIKVMQSKLIEAERLAAITETAISVNHEINNPLCSILGNTQLMLMQRDNLDPNIVNKLHSIEKQISRIQEIAKQLGKITNPVLKEYIGGKKMLDVKHSGKKRIRQPVNK